MTRLRGDALRVAGADAAGGREGPRAARSIRVFEKWDLHAEADRHASPPTSACASSTTARSRPTCPTRRSPTRRRSTTGPGSSRRTRPRPRTCSRSPPPADLGEALLRAARLARRSRASAGSTGSTTRTVRTNTAGRPGLRRGRGARQGHAARRSPWPSTATAATAGSIPTRARSLAVAEACRNVAAAGAVPDRRHQLPELRQPREARDHGPARDGDPRHRRGLPRARACRSPAATSRSTTRPTAQAIYPTPVIGVVGLLEDASQGAHVAGSGRAATPVYLLGDDRRRPGRQRVPEGHPRPRGGPAAAAGPRGREAAARAAWPRRRPRGVLRSAHDLERRRPGRGAGRVLLRAARSPASARASSCPAGLRRRRAALLRNALAHGRDDARRRRGSRSWPAPRRALRRARSGRRRPPRRWRPTAGRSWTCPSRRCTKPG